MAQKDPKVNPRPLAPTAANMNAVPVGRPVVAQPQRGKAVPKKGPKGGGEPTTAAHPRQIMERMGARRRIEVNLPGPQLPEARATQANGKIMPAVMGQKNNFFGGTASGG